MELVKIEPNSPIYNLAVQIYGKESLNAEELNCILEMDKRMLPTELIVSAAEKRQVASYESNDYFISTKTSLSDLAEYIINSADNEPSLTAKLDKYLELKSIMGKMIGHKYSMTENWLRDLIHKQQRDDGITNIK